MVGIWAWRLRSCVYAFAEKGRRAVKQLRPSRREKRRETIALMTAFLTNPGGDGAEPEEMGRFRLRPKHLSG